MAKEDFCFTYYDGDAARDMAHMNRLERGAYQDITLSQRKFGHMKLSLIKKTLGNDFDTVWESLEIILKQDEEEKFYIEWLDTSITKMKKQSSHQSINGKKGGRPKANKNPNDNPNETQTDDKKKPLEDGYGNGDVSSSFEKSEKLLVPEMQKIWVQKFPKYFLEKEKDFPALQKISTNIAQLVGVSDNPLSQTSEETHQIKLRWGEMVEFISREDFFKNYSLSQVDRHFQSILQKEKNGNNTSKKPQRVGREIEFEAL